MEDHSLIEQTHTHSGAFALVNFGTQFTEQRFDFPPGNVGTGWMAEDGLKRSLVSAFH